MVFAFALLVGCGGAPGPLIPEQQRDRAADSRPPPAPAPEAYRVRRGDTLYSIAFRYGLDWRNVARWNGITAPYTIHVGDWIRLQPQPDMRPAVVVSPRPAQQSTPRRETGSEAQSPSQASRDRTAPTAAESGTEMEMEAETETGPDRAAARAPTESSTGSRARTRPEPQPAAGDRAANTDSPPPAPTRNVGGVAWRWPTEGRVARVFNAGASRKGILIAGRGGQAVRAAAEGEVVYSGNGLLGYGELIIVKHSDRMLSAYAHNRERLVGEGDRVRSGQLIARMGSNERDENVLHFEIRQDGKPSDPVEFLPRR
ncbi:MAG: peptidoglycan DD-metalloendopeptidase family protein [Wenzhouxiangellaceae bacterium]